MARSKQLVLDLSGRNALIAGASRGLGLQLARILGAAGARVMLCARQPAALEQAVAQLQDSGIDARWCAADCTQPGQVAYLVGETLQRMGDIDILVNNAGLASNPDHALEPRPQLPAPTVRSYFWLCQAVAERSMMARRSGQIIQVAPMAQPSLAADVIALTRELAKAWSGYRIGVNALCVHAGSPDSTATLAPGCADGGDDALRGLASWLAQQASRPISGSCQTPGTGNSACGSAGR